MLHNTRTVLIGPSVAAGVTAVATAWMGALPHRVAWLLPWALAILVLFDAASAQSICYSNPLAVLNNNWNCKGTASGAQCVGKCNPGVCAGEQATNRERPSAHTCKDVRHATSYSLAVHAVGVVCLCVPEKSGWRATWAVTALVLANMMSWFFACCRL